jgi:cation transport ATPase
VTARDLTVPDADLAACATCRASVDTLRAAGVRYVDLAFRFYCSRECRERDTPTPRRHRRTPALARPAPPSTVEVMEMLGVAPASLPDAARTDLAPALDADLAARHRPSEPANPLPPTLAVAAALAATVLASLDVAPLGTRAAMLVLTVVVALGTALRELWLARGTVGVAGWSLGLVGALLPTALASRAELGEIVLALRDTVMLAALGPVVTWAARTHRVAAQSRLEAFRLALPAEAMVPREGTDGAPELEAVDASKVRAGTEVEVRAGEVVPVDGVIRAGEAEVRPWPSAQRTMRRGVGAPVLAGARVLGGALRVLATRAGDEVAWARLARMMNDSAEGPRTVRLARRLAELVPLGVLAAAGATALLRVFFAAGDVGRAVACVLAMAPCALAASVVEIPFIDALVAAARRGIVFRDAASVEAVGAVGTVALCLRGTVTRGAMELTDVVSLGARSERELLGLVAGCEEAMRGDAIALAVAAAAAAREVRPESVRRPVALGSHGVLAVSASGEPIVVGDTRALLDEGISVAQGQSVSAAIEGAGRTVVYVATDGRLEGVIGLDDPVRDEARASVQTLIDVGFDVALLGGASRLTMEAVAASLDVSNVRPEVLHEERAAVVRGMSEIGNGVVVVGRPARDGAALAAADAAISLEAAGGGGGETAVALASDDLRDAAAALVVARAARQRAVRVIALGIGGAGLGAFAAAAIPSAGMIGVIGATAAILAGQAALLRAPREQEET